MTNRTDQADTRHVGDRVAPPTTPDKATIAEDRKALDDDHEADRMPTEEEEQAAERLGAPSPQVEEAYEEALERGAKQQGEGKPGL
jgi:uncharacterized protein (DUF2126 family)